jgi:WD40 repeat protein
MTNDHLYSERVAELAQEFLLRCRRGERPQLSEYTSQHPEYAAEIREVFPMLLLMEDIAPVEDGHREQLDSQLERLGDFVIHRVIGRGGMGVVYEATQESLGRRVALKVCPLTRGMSSRNRERFRRESRAAAMLHHTNIASVFAVGEEQGLLYYSMQFIQGATLDDVIQELRLIWKSAPTATTRLTTGVHHFSRQSSAPSSPSKRERALNASKVAHSLVGWASDLKSQDSRPSSEAKLEATAGEGLPVTTDVSLPGQSGGDSHNGSTAKYWESVGRIGVQVAEALAYAHAKGMLHRDIKPGNLMLDQSGIVWVLDFGLAKSPEEEDLTQDGELIGTLRYMAPEQVSGNPTASSDIYGLGLTLYELLTLRPAFEDANRSALLKAIVENDIVPPRRINAHVPLDLETIVLKAIDREPGRRYPDAQSLADDLHRFLAGEPIHARRVSLAERMGKWVRRRPAVATLLACLAALFVISFVVVSWKWRDAEDKKLLALAAAAAEKSARAEAEAQQSLAEARLDETEQALYRSAISRAEATAATAPETARRILASLVPRAGDVDRRGWEWGYLTQLVNQEVAVLQAGAPEAEWIWALAFSHDERLLAVGAGRTGFVFPQDRSPRGRVTIWDTNTAELVTELPIEHSAYALAFSRDNRRLTVSEPVATNHLEYTRFGPVRVWDIENAQPLCQLESTDETTRIRSLQFCSQDRLIVGVDCKQTPTTHGWDADSGQLLWSLPQVELVKIDEEANSFVAARFAPTRELVRFDLDTQAEQEVLGDLPATGSYQPTTRGVLGAFLPNARARLYLQQLNSDHQKMLWGDDRYKVSMVYPARPLVVVHPTEPTVAAAAADGTVRLWHAATGEIQRILRGHAANVQAIAYSPSGRWLASGDWAGEVRIWRPEIYAQHVNCRPRNTDPDQCFIEDIAFRFGSSNLVGFGHLIDAGRFWAPRTERVTTWDAESGLRLAEFQTPGVPQLKHRRQAKFDDSGTRLAMVGRDNIIRVVDFENGKTLFASEPFAAEVQEVTFSGNGTRVAAFTIADSAADEKQARAVVWDVPSGGQVAALTSPQFVKIALDQQGERLAAASVSPDGTDWQVEVHGLTAGSLMRLPDHRQATIDRDAISALAFSHGGDKLAVCSLYGELAVFDAATGKTIVPSYQVPVGIEDLAWHPSDTRLAGANREAVTLWDTAVNEILVLKGRPRSGDMPFDPAVTFSGDGSKLAASQWDNSINIWNVERPYGSASMVHDSSFRHTTRDEFALETIHRTVEAVPSNPWYTAARGQLGRFLRTADATRRDYLNAKERLAGDEPCLLIHGQAYITAPSLPLHELGNAFGGHTLEAWVKHWNYQQPSFTYGVIAAQYPRSPTDYFEYQAHRASRALDEYGSYWLRPTQAYRSVADQWSHVAVCFGADGRTYFLNGKSTGTSPPVTFAEQMEDFHISSGRRSSRLSSPAGTAGCDGTKSGERANGPTD